MSALIKALRDHATHTPERSAVSDGVHTLSYRQLVNCVDVIANQLNALDLPVLGLLADNGIDWIAADLAALSAQRTLIPLPLFFSPQQLLHAIAESGMNVVLCDQPERLDALLRDAGVRTEPAIALCGLDRLRLLRFAPIKLAHSALPRGTAKVTFTSGTTGTPKGVCLSSAQMHAVTQSLLASTQADSSDRHLCLTPLSTLLENIGGVYVPLLAGACTFALPLAQVGLRGASGLDPMRMLQAMSETAATSAIMVPQMLQGLLFAIGRGGSAPASLRFVAVGGAPVSQRMLETARAHSIPVYEGYGLSECASVVALNTPGDTRPGTVGRPLPHLKLSFADDGEILVSGAGFLGYLGDKAAPQPLPTGDIGYLDEAGFLHLQGRKKSIFITSFGRNVAPEWVERELTAHPAILQAAVFGESLPFNTAVISAAPGATTADVQNAIDAANRTLPDYARVQRWLPAQQPFSMLNQQMTSNGRLKRDSIWSAYSNLVNAFYQEELHAVL
jgi:long-chain acyl-CoA synthetase